MILSKSKNKKNLIKIGEKFFLIEVESAGSYSGSPSPGSGIMQLAKSSNQLREYAITPKSYCIEVFIDPIALVNANASMIKVNAYSIHPDIDFSFKGKGAKQFNKEVLCFDNNSRVKLKSKNNLSVGRGYKRLSRTIRKYYETVRATSKKSSKQLSSRITLKKNTSAVIMEYLEDGTINSDVDRGLVDIIKIISKDTDLGCLEKNSSPLFQGPISIYTSNESTPGNSRINAMMRLSSTPTQTMQTFIPIDGVEERTASTNGFSPYAGLAAYSSYISSLNRAGRSEESANIMRGDTSPQTFLRVKSDLKYISCKIPFRFRIPIEDIMSALGNIYVEFLVTNTRDAVIERHIRKISTQVIVTTPETNILPPKISAGRTRSTAVMIDIQQVDPEAKLVFLQKAVCSAEDYVLGNDMVYKDKGYYSVTAAQGPIQVPDTRNTVGYLTYRAFAVDASGKKSKELSEYTVPPHTSRGKEKSPPVKKISRKIIARIRVDEPMKEHGSIVRAEIRGLTRSARMFYIKSSKGGRATDIEKNRVDMQPIGFEKASSGISERMRGIFFHPLSEISPGGIYEYFVEVITADGTVQVVRPSIKHQYTALTKQVGIDFRVEKSSDSNSSSGTTFNIKANFNSDTIDMIVKSLKSVGAFESFLSDVQNNRDRFSSLLKVKIYRTDVSVTPNETYSLGLQDVNTIYSDVSSSNQKTNIPGLSAGHEYVYRFELFVAPFSILLDRVEIEKQDPKTLQIIKDITSEFQGRLTKDRSTLPPAQKRVGDKDVNVDEVFTANSTGKVITISTSIPGISCKIQSLKGKKVGDKVALFWKVSGDSSKISKFLIFCDYNGLKCKIATVAFSSFSPKSYEYIDEKMSTRVGKKIYTVVPIFHSLGTGEESNPVVITTYSSVKKLEEERKHGEGNESKYAAKSPERIKKSR